MDDYLFVYGTLMRGARHPMGALLAKHSQFIGEARFNGRLYLVAHFPGAIASADPDDQVFGEVFRLHRGTDVLARLDDYEGCGPDAPEPAQYRRERHPVTLTDGTAITAWVYVYNRPVDRLERISSGVFL